MPLHRTLKVVPNHAQPHDMGQRGPGWFWPHAFVTPTEEDDRPEGRRYTDASRLKFSWRDLVLVVSVAVSIWTVTWSLRSDVRDILTRMEMETKLDIEKSRVLDERAAMLRESIDAMKRRQELQQYEIQALKEMILTMKGGAK
jgi:hypothetical protein